MAVTLRGLPQLRRRLAAVERAAGRPLLAQIQLDATANAKRLVPRKTGNLGRSIRPGGLTNDYTIVRATAGYAAFVEFATRPHVIKPKKARRLAWPAAGSARLSGTARRGGQMIFAGKVNHPGTKAQPFLVPGARKAIEDNTGRSVIVREWNDAA